MRLAAVFEGWEGYQQSLEHAVEPLTAVQLSWRPSAGFRSLGEVIRHLSLGRITWLARMHPAGMEAAMAQVPRWQADEEGERHVDESAVAADDPGALAYWLRVSWEPIQAILGAWSVDDLAVTYPHRFDGNVYAISRQWTLWRILSHDQHHGGQIAMMLAMQGIPAHELRSLGGHVVTPPVARE